MKPLLLVLLLAEVVIGDLSDYSKTNFAFSNNFYKKALAPIEENFVFSPAALQALMAILASGALGETQDQLLKVAQFPNDPYKVTEMYRELGETLTQKQSITLPSLTVYTGSGSVKLSTIYEMFLKDTFKVYISTSESSLSIPKNPLSSNVVVFSNGVVFKYQLILNGTWETKFNPAQPSTFHLTKNKTVTIDMLQVTEELNYHYNEVLLAEILEIPIIHNELTLTIVLPSEADGLAYVEKYLPHACSIQPYRKLNVSVTIPKYWDLKSHNLTSNLASLGLATLFFNEAEFKVPWAPEETTRPPRYGEILSNEVKRHRKSSVPVKIREGTHKTIIDIISDDQQFSSTTVNPQQQIDKSFIADRPFLYYINHPVLKRVAIGRFMKPKYIYYDQ